LEPSLDIQPLDNSRLEILALPAQQQATFADFIDFSATKLPQRLRLIL